MPLEAWWIAVALLAITWFFPLLAGSLYTRFENALTKLATSRSFSVLLIFLATIGIRLLLLPILPYPRPWVHDEFSYLLQGDIFAHGRLSYPSHPMAVYFQTFYENFQPTYSSIYPPAQAAVLALGYLLGHPWIGVLLSTGAMVAAILWMLQGWFPPQWALLGAVFVLCRIAIFSYWMNGYWGGSVPAIGGALVLGALPRLRRRLRTRDALLLGVGVVILANSRPLEGLIFCLPVFAALFVWLVRLAIKGRPLPIRSALLPIAACLCASLAFTLYYNWRLTLSPWLMPHTLFEREFVRVPLVLWQERPAPIHYVNPQFEGFFNIWMPAQYHGTWPDALHVTRVKFQKLWEFFVGLWFSLPFLTLPWLIRDHRIRLFMATIVICTLGLLPVTWFNPHYAAPMLCAFIGLLVQAMRHLRRWRFRRRLVGIGWTRVIVTLLLLQLPACAIEAARAPHMPCCHDMPHNWERAEIVEKLKKTPGQHLVLVRYGLMHNIHGEWVFNSADIDHSKIVWAREIPEMDLTPLLNYYSSRKVWVVEPDSGVPRLYPYSPETNSASGNPMPSSPPQALPTSSSPALRGANQSQ